jgi:hypothetical protein
MRAPARPVRENSGGRPGAPMRVCRPLARLMKVGAGCGEGVRREDLENSACGGVQVPPYERQGRGDPSPSAPPPGAIATTVHYPGTSREKNQVQTIPQPAAPAPISTGYHDDCPRPWGRGRRPEAGRGGGYEYRDPVRQGRGDPPIAISTTVRCPGTSPVITRVSDHRAADR